MIYCVPLILQPEARLLFSPSSLPCAACNWLFLFLFLGYFGRRSNIPGGGQNLRVGCDDCLATAAERLGLVEELGRITTTNRQTRVSHWFEEVGEVD